MQDLIASGFKLAAPIVIQVPTFIVSDINFNMMMGRSGIFNLYAISTTINEGEIRRSLGQTAPMPNVVRVRILSARKLLNLPNLQPRIEVSIRKVKLSTGKGKRGIESDDGSTLYHFDSAEFVLPTPNCESVLVVRVYNDNVGFGRSPQLVGQWFMTLKWLIQCPEHCKHKKGTLTATGDGGIAGTFLLTDAKLQGSAVRVLGPHDLGAGFSGELDMAIQWTHTTLLDPAPDDWTLRSSPHAGERLMGPAIGAIDQLGSTGDDDGLRIGNGAEFKEFLSGVPIRISTDHFVFRKVAIEMADLFTGAGAGHRTGNSAYISELSFKPMHEVSLYSLGWELAQQVIPRVAVDLTALYTATAEVLAGVTTGVGKSLASGFKAVGNALDVDGDGTYSLGDVTHAGKSVVSTTASGIKGVGNAVHNAFDLNKDGKIDVKDAGALAKKTSNAATAIQARMRGKLARKPK